MKSPGQLAFEAYNHAKGGVTYDGKPIPPWTDVGDAVRAGWEVAAGAVLATTPGARAGYRDAARIARERAAFHRRQRERFMAPSTPEDALELLAEELESYAGPDASPAARAHIERLEERAASDRCTTGPQAGSLHVWSEGACFRCGAKAVAP